MNHTQLFNSFLMQQFHEFYNELICQKQHIESKDANPSDAGLIQTAAPEKELSHQIHARLLYVLKRQLQEARGHGGEYSANFYMEAQYVMAALADEIFLSMKWDGREAWKSNLMEFELFGTNAAGEKFFNQLDSLLKNHDPTLIEIAGIYLFSLSLGFRGKYRDADDSGRIDCYRKQLYSFIFHKNPDLQDETRRLFPDTYAYTLSKDSGKKLPSMRKWIGAILILVLVYIVVSSAIWSNVTEDLIRVVEHILNGNSLVL
ncbi:MAG: DotU family type IV/VI secretion system protein [Desulfobacterales bacterium]|nr:DotU family type IV/VI secretion system protein [Desulfobacterales bacterium]MDD4073217.1 DotU family type IV/VI secretion system protein [Desulfobacterales bacterium]MDD4393791.1 DotU family type IV/VI secretion system protein [Desulfobacterales bacterium]